MKNFDNTFSRERGGSSTGGGSRGGGYGKRQFNGRDRERPQMHEAICSDCGKRCEVPFRPTGDKPIYCSQCFSSHREGQVSSGSERRVYEKPRFQDRRMFDAVCDKCGKKFELPFRPTGERPVYCSGCFDRGGNPVSKNNDRAVDQYKEQFDTLNFKLDRIIKALTPAVPSKPEKKEKTKKSKRK